jgi:hypothetical protein
MKSLIEIGETLFQDGKIDNACFIFRIRENSNKEKVGLFFNEEQ